MKMYVRWVVAVVGVAALSAVAVNHYMPWLARESRLPVADVHGASVACPADAKAANLSFTLKDVAGKNVTLESFRGKVILLDFWATWCGPCKVEIPGFVKFQKRYGPQGFQVVGVSVDDSVELLEPFMKKYGMNYPVLQGLGRDDVIEAYGAVVGLPHTVLISRDGKVCAEHTGLEREEVFARGIEALL